MADYLLHGISSKLSFTYLPTLVARLWGWGRMAPLTTPHSYWEPTQAHRSPPHTTPGTQPLVYNNHPIQPLVGLLHNHNYTTLNNSCRTTTSIKPSHTTPSWATTQPHNTTLYKMCACLYTYFYIAAWALAISVFCSVGGLSINVFNRNPSKTGLICFLIAD